MGHFAMVVGLMVQGVDLGLNLSSLGGGKSAKGWGGMGRGGKGTASGSDAKGGGGGKCGGGSKGGRGSSVSSSRSDTAGGWRREG